MHNLREVQLATGQGGAFTLDLKRFEEGISCITRGLFFKETHRKLRVPLDVMWSVLRFPSSLEAPFRDVIEKWEGLLPPTFKGNQPRVFQYAFHYFRGIGNWLCRMRFYEGPTLYIHWVPAEETDFADVVARHPFAIRGRTDQLVEECERELQKEIEIATTLATENFEKFAALIVSLLKAYPNYRKKKDINPHIDGIGFFHDLDREDVHIMLLSVKSGENVGSAMVKDLITTLAHDKADIGLFITLAAPTKAMITEAAAAGFYESPNGMKYPRLQLLTITGLLDGTQSVLYPDYKPDLGYTKSQG